MWHYLPKRWGGDVAEDVYRNVLAPALKRHRGEKRRYILLEDNDPTGLKASIAMAAKAAMKIQPIAFPTYSPDLNPLDYALWQEVENRMGRQQAPAGETIWGIQGPLEPHCQVHPDARCDQDVGFDAGAHPECLRVRRWAHPEGLRAPERAPPVHPVRILRIT